MQQNTFFSLEQVIDRQPITVSVETPLNEAIALMHQHGNHCTVAEGETNAVRGNSSCVLVVEGERLRGIFTERDLVKLVARRTDTQGVTVGEMMTEDVVTIVATDDKDIFSALTLLKEHRVRHLPVVDEAQNLLGLITAKSIRQKLQPINLMKWRKVAEVMESRVVYAPPDESIRSIASLMADNKISCVAIAKTQSDTDNHLVQPIGIITERDIVQFQNLGLDLELPARDYMSAPLFLASPEDSLWDIYQQMKQRRVRRLLVGGELGELAGIITQSSLLQVFDPTEMYGVIEVLQRQVSQLETEREVLLQERNNKLEREVEAGSQAIANIIAQAYERFQAETALQASEQKFDSILGSLNDIVWSVDAQTFKPIYINQAAERIYGYSVAEFYQNDNLWLEAVHPDDRDRVSEFSHRALETGTLEMEYRIVRPDGEIRWLLDSANVTYDAENRPLRLDGNSTDITDRKQGEVLIRESQERYTLAVAGSSNGLWDWNVITNEVFYAPRWKEILGCTDADLANTFEAWSSRLHPDDQDRVMAALQNHLENRVPYNIEYRLRKQDGEYCWVVARGQAIWDEAGEAIRMAGSIADISDRKKRDRELRRQALIYKSAYDGIILTDPQGQIVDWNPAATRIFGYSKSEAVGLTPSMLHKLEESATLTQTILEGMRENGSWAGEINFVRKDGTEGICETIVVPQYDERNKLIGTIGVNRDISDRKKRERILRDIASGVSVEVGKNFFFSLVEFLSKTLEVNFAFVSKLIGSDVREVETLAVYGNGENLDNFVYSLFNAPCGNVIERGLCLYPEAVRQLFPNIPPLETMNAESYAGMPIFDACGNVLGLVAVVDSKPFTDTTLIEEVLRIFASRASAELERQQAELALKQSNQILQAISSIQTQFLTDVAAQIIFDGMLEQLLELTASEYGFIGEIHVAEDGSRTMEESYMKFRGRPYLKTHAITNIAWNEETRAFYAENAPKGMEFHNLQTLFGAVIVTGEPVIANSPSDDPRRGGLPDGHPPLNAFLGVPFYKNGQMTGMAGIANRKGGYDESTIEYLRPLLDTCSRIIEAYKSERQAALRERYRQQAEAKNREQAALLDVATDAIMVRGLDNQLLFWNRGAERLYGWTQAEALQKDAEGLLYRRSLSKLTQIQQTAIAQGEWQGELNQVTKSGKEILVKSRWTVVKDELGNPESFLIVNTDITEQKQLEAQFLRTQRLESLGTLAGGIAHDLNNILAPILGFSKLLPLKLPNVDEQTKGFFKIMENNANRGTALVKQILTFSRGLEGEKGIVQIRHLINEIAQIINETFPRSIQLETNVPKNLQTVNADINQLHQVLMNLSVNARDAMTDGGTLTIDAKNTTVDAEYVRLHLDATVGNYVLITVSDTGVGISPEAIDRIFEPFFTTKEVGRGTGLGLSTVIGIVKSHGGFIDVESSRQRATRGTKFKVFLPASDIAENNIEEPETDLRGNGELILVVDDETAILEVTQATLETYNYQVLTASDGIKAIATYAQNQEKIEAVIMDIMMPNMDGKTAIRTLRQINPELKIIAVSGLIERQEIVSEIDGDVIAFMNKPYSNDDLLQTINLVINNRAE